MNEKEFNRQRLEKALQKDPSNQLNAMRHLLKIKNSFEPDFTLSKIPNAFYNNIVRKNVLEW